MGFLRLWPPAARRQTANARGRGRTRTDTNEHVENGPEYARNYPREPAPSLPARPHRLRIARQYPDTPVPPPHLRDSPAPQPPPAQPAALPTSPLLHCGTTSPPLLAPTGTVPSLICALSTSASNASSRAMTLGRCVRKNSTQVRVFASMNLRDGYSA
ncbi:hypothetical protein SAMN02787142_4813 [Burkholderia sp. WP9]|nr:hypothetical protein SAMN02787142_4813 [Burkholderia sp. WP9]